MERRWLYIEIKESLINIENKIRLRKALGTDSPYHYRAGLVIYIANNNWINASLRVASVQVTKVVRKV